MDALVKFRYAHDFERDALADAEHARLVRAIVERFPRRRCRRVLFVAIPQVPEAVFDYASARAGRYPCFPPYGPGVLARALAATGTSAEIVDLQYEILEAAHRAPDQTSFDPLAWQVALDRAVAAFQPDLFGLSCMFDMGHAWLKTVAAFLRGRFPAVPIVAGGVHLTLTVERLLKETPAIDFAFLYEADQTFPDFLRFVNGEADGAGLAQLACLVDGRVLKLTKRNAPAELAHAPDFRALPIQRYSQVGKIGAYTFLRPATAAATTVLSTRGCRAHCGFCSVRSVNGPGVRTRPVEAVVDEVAEAVARYGVRHVMWLDDDLFYDRARAIALFSALADRRLGVTWDASNGVIAAALNEELLQACVRSGCVGLSFGIESGNDGMLKLMQKPGTVRAFRKAAALVDRTPQVFTKGMLMAGFPRETAAMLNDTVRLALEMRMDWYPIQVVTPLPGTPIFKMMADLNLFGDVPAASSEVKIYSVGATGSIRKREAQEKLAARPFRDLLAGDQQAYVPRREELDDVWFALDYRVNYEPILALDDVARLRKKAAMLKEICERMTTDNALGLLFYGVVLAKLGRPSAARQVAQEARRCHDASEFWRLRFEAFGLDARLAALETGLAA